VAPRSPGPIGPKGLTIGRTAENDWVIDNPYVSRKHAEIRYVAGGFFIISWGSNAVAIGHINNRLVRGQPRSLSDGDHIFIDDYEVVAKLFDGEVPVERGVMDDDPFEDSPSESVATPSITGFLEPRERDPLDLSCLGSLSAAGVRPPGAEHRASVPADWDHISLSSPILPPPMRPGARIPERSVDDFGEWSQPPSALHGSLPVARNEHGEPTGSYYRVWFGTNRRPVNSFHPNEGFDSSPDPSVHVGSCVVRVPHAHRAGSIGSSALQRIFVLRADDRLALESIQTVDCDRLLEELRAGLSVDPERRALIYIHGYNTTFAGAAVRAAQIGFDLGIRGIMAFFSWPSHGALRHYLADATAIELAEDAFVEFLQLLMRVEGIQHIDILAHSMGNRLLLRTIPILSQLKRIAGRNLGIRHLLLAAPDVDIGKFSQVAEHYRSVPDKWTTVYTCRKDLAIAASTWLSDAKRLSYEPPVYSDFGLDTISASLLPLDWLGHGYFAAARPLLADMAAILDRDARPEARRLLPVGGQPPNFWRLR
jgi:esterase/lipase superfamily enzyme